MQIPLGVQLKNENKLEEMAHILEEFHNKYVPTLSSEATTTLPDESTRTFDNTQFHTILIGGDQLTVARIRGATNLRSSHAKSADRLEGTVPVVEDWHARMTLMKVNSIYSVTLINFAISIIQVLWGRLFNKLSVSERGTMYQIRNLLNRTAVPADPENHMKAAEDFMLLLLHTHIIAAAKQLLQYDIGSPSLSYVAKSIVNTHLLLPDTLPNPGTAVDGVTLYARELITLSLLWHYFHDATREADGDRLLLSWKIMLPVFKATNHRNYAKEAVLLILQSNYFSDRKRSQLLWSRCVNTKGREGTNIPCDLHIEHLNRRLKTILRSMGANLSNEAIVRAGKSLRAVHNVCLQFEEETCSPVQTHLAHSGVHNVPSFGKDFKTLLTLLIDEKVLQPHQTRFHPSFLFQKGLLQHNTKKELSKKIKRTLRGLVI